MYIHVELSRERIVKKGMKTVQVGIVLTEKNIWKKKTT